MGNDGERRRHDPRPHRLVEREQRDIGRPAHPEILQVEQTLGSGLNRELQIGEVQAGGDSKR